MPHREKEYDFDAGRRRARRIIAKWVLPIFGVLLILVIMAMWALSTETVWRRYIIPRQFGPYWDTVLKWDEFRPQIFPPAVTITNLTIVEPGADGDAVIYVEELVLGLSARTRSDNVHIRNLKVLNAELNLVMYGEEDSNLTRAIARLYQGMPSTGPAPPPRAISVPRIHVANLELEGMHLHFIDHRFPGYAIEAEYTTSGPILAVVNEFSEHFEPGRLDNYLRLNMRGLLRARVNEWRAESLGNLDVTAADLGSFPRNRFTTRMVLYPVKDEDFEVVAGFDALATRIPTRPIATNFERIFVDARRTGESESFFVLEDTSFDPLHGALNLSYRLDGEWKTIQAAIDSFLVPESASALRETIASKSWAEGILTHDAPLPVRSSGTVEARGIAQYAIVSQNEVVPITLRTQGTLELAGIPLPALEIPSQVGDGDLEPAVSDQPFPADVSYQWKFSADERRQVGNVWMRMDAVPSKSRREEMNLTVTLSDAQNQEEGVQFNPFAGGLLDAIELALEQQQQEARPVYTLFAAYEEMLLGISRQMDAAFRILDAAGMEDAALRHHFVVSDGATMRNLAEPIVGPMHGSTGGEVRFTVTRPGGGRPSEWSGGFRVSGMEIDGVPGTVDMEALADLLRDGAVMTARELQFRLTRSGGDLESPEVLLLSLPRVGRDGEDGPIRPSYLNFLTGEGFFQLRADTLNREIMEVLLRIQTFGLSDRLAQPAMQRMLDTFGFRPGDPASIGEAVAHLSAELGGIMTISTLLDVRNVPAGNFLFLPAEDDPLMERFDILLAQTTRLDRRTELLHPIEFDLSLFIPGADGPFANIGLQTDEGTAFSFPDLQGLAAVETESLATEGPREQTLRDLVLAFFERTDRVRAALRNGGGRIVLSLPEVELGQLRNTIQAAGFPIQGGNLDLRLETALNPSEHQIGSHAHGTFHVNNLVITGLEGEPFPPAFGTLNLSHEGNFLHLRDLSTSLQLDPEFDPTQVRFMGSLQTDTMDSTWTLSLDGIHGGVLRALQRVQTKGVAGAVTILENLPLQSLAAMAGQEGNVALRFDAQTNGADGKARLVATQTGRNLDALPGLFNPFSFDLTQTIFHHDTDAFTLEKLDGELREEGGSAPLLTLHLDRPLAFGENIISDHEDTVLLLHAEKNLSEIAERLVDFPLPLYQRPVGGGMISGDLRILFPDGQFMPDTERTEVVNEFELLLKDVELVGYPQTFDGELRGIFRRTPGLWALEDVTLESRVGTMPTGTLSLDATYDGNNAHAVMDLIDFRSLLLDALPERFSAWTQQPRSTLNLHAEFDSSSAFSNADMRLSTRARHFGLPALPLPDESAFTHPPLHLDVDVASSMNFDTGEVIVHETGIRLVKAEELPPADRLAPLPDDLEPLLTVAQTGTIIYRPETASFDPATEEGAGLAAAIGPIDLAEYGAVLYQALGLPLTEGTWSGTAAMQAIGTGGTRLNRLSGNMLLDNVLWAGSNGSEQRVSAEMNLSADVLRNVVRLTDLTLRARYPDEATRPIDHLQMRGFYEYGPLAPDSFHDAELNIDSDGLALDRLLGFMDDHLDSRERLRRPLLLADEEVIRPHAIAEQHLVTIPEDLVASLNGQLRNVTFRELSLPRTTVRARYEAGLLSLHEFRARLAQGDIALSGGVDLSDAGNPWTLTGNVDRLEARPWVNSFASRELHDKFGGTLAAALNLEGTGFGEADWRTIQGRIKVQLQDALFAQSGIGLVMGSEADLAADLDLLIRGNRLLFKLATPWNAARDITIQGSIRDFFPGEGSVPYVSAVADYKRTSTVGPSGRTMKHRGRTVPYRQVLFGLIVELLGPMEEHRNPAVRVRSVHY